MARTSTTWEKGQAPPNPKGSSAIKREENCFLRKAFREKNDEYVAQIDRLIYNAEDESTQLRALIFAIEMGNGKAPQALSIELETKDTKPQEVIITHVYTKEALEKRIKENDNLPENTRKECY